MQHTSNCMVSHWCDTVTTVSFSINLPSCARASIVKPFGIAWQHFTTHMMMNGRIVHSVPFRFHLVQISGDRCALCSSSLSFLCFHISLNSRVHDIIRSNQICMKVSDVIPLTPTVYQMYISRVYSVGVRFGSVEALFRAYIHRSWNGKLMFLTTDTLARVCVCMIYLNLIYPKTHTHWNGKEFVVRSLSRWMVSSPSSSA